MWLEGVFDEKTVMKFKGISAAANAWQEGFLKALVRTSSKVTVIGFPSEPIWPKGKMVIRKDSLSSIFGITTYPTGYLNLLFLKRFTQLIRLKKVALSLILKKKVKPDYTVVYSCQVPGQMLSPGIKLAKFLKKKFRIPWICVVADGVTPKGADGYVYLPWSNYDNRQVNQPAIHLDGGIYRPDTWFSKKIQHTTRISKKAFMYAGSLGEHGGVMQLARAFFQVKDKTLELWIFGRGINPELRKIVELDQRIKLFGFVDQNKLNYYSSQAYAFVNPRPISFEPNKHNYPSKLLYYLYFEKPIISTFSDGLCPSYKEVLFDLVDESEAQFANAIESVSKMDRLLYIKACQKVMKFNQKHTWQFQIERFIKWINQFGQSGQIQ